MAASAAAPSPAETLGTALRRAAQQRPEKAALRAGRGAGRVEVTYGELLQGIASGAARLRALGVEPGDRIGLWSENRPEWLRAYFTILEARATAVPLDRQLKEPDVRHILEVSEARALIASASALATLPGDAQDALRARGVPLLALAPELGYSPGSAESCGPRAPGPDDRDPEVASLIFTSGTTGRPRGVMLTHENLLASVHAAMELNPFTAGDEALSILPLHHVFEFCGELEALLCGATLTYIEAIRADVILEAMRDSGTTVMGAVPRLLELFHAGIARRVAERGPAARGFAALKQAARAARRLGFDPRRRLFRRVHEQFGGRLRLVLSGAAALPAEVWRGLDELGFPVIEGYGLTETAPLVACHSLHTRRPGSVGPPVPGVELRIVNPNSAGEGEISVRGKTVMRGYFRDPAATRAAIRDGWFHTGDLGRVERDGHLVITGRVKELIVTSAGKNVSPPDVEARYGSIAGVRELCVFGARGKSLGEEVHAALVLEGVGAGDEATRREIGERLSARADSAGIPSYMRIQRFHLVPEIPRTTTLKPKRHELRALAAQAHEGRDLEAAIRGEAGSTLAGVLEVLRAVARERASGAGLESTLQFDVGLDSLERLDLVAGLESRFGTRLPADLPPRLHSVRDAVAAVERSLGGPEPSAAPPAAAAAGAPPMRAGGGRLALDAFALTARAVYGLRAEGLGQLPRGPAILCPNHESHLDVFFVASVLPPELRRGLVCFAKREHFEQSGTRALARLAGAVPVDRDGDVRAALRAGSLALRAGRPLLIHPEGTRTKTGALGPFRAGAALLALECGVPLVPVRIHGAFSIFPESRALPRLADWRRARRLPLVIAFGAPIPPAHGVSADQLTARLREAVAAL